MNANIDEDRFLAEGTAASRRTLMRGMLGVGCSLLLPAVLSGCDSKKSATPTGVEPASSPATSAAPAAAAATGKVAQASVQYQTQPKGEQKCSGCAKFIAQSNACKLVDGPISPDGCCSVWTQKPEPTTVLTAIRTRPMSQPTDNIRRTT